MIARVIVIASAAAFCAPRADAAPLPCNASGMTAPAASNSHLIASDYPILSVLLHEEGDTVVSFVVGTDGKTAAQAVAQSSGSLRLDDASMEAVRGWLYNPALSGGVPTACVQRALVKWRIPEEAQPPKKAQ